VEFLLSVALCHGIVQHYTFFLWNSIAPNGTLLVEWWCISCCVTHCILHCATAGGSIAHCAVINAMLWHWQLQWQHHFCSAIKRVGKIYVGIDFCSVVGGISAKWAIKRQSINGSLKQVFSGVSI